MQPATVAAEDVLTSTERPADSEDRTMRLTGGSMLTLANDLRADDWREAETRRLISPSTATSAADPAPTATRAQRPSRGGSTLLAGLRRIAAIGPHA